MKIQKQTYKQIQITNGFMPLKKTSKCVDDDDEDFQIAN